jgi:hypothetical protein
MQIARVRRELSWRWYCNLTRSGTPVTLKAPVRTDVRTLGGAEQR